MEKKQEAEVLLVNDEEDFIQTLAQSLEMRGLKATAVNSGAEAVHLEDKHTYDAMVLELIMPGMDGMESLDVFYS